MSRFIDLDPALFRPEAIDDETRAFNEQLEALLATRPSNVGRVPQEIRDERRAGHGIFPAPVFSERAETRAIAGPGGDLPLRIFRPATINGVYLHIHGGGWTLGAADLHDAALETLAHSASLAVVSVDYRLAPEHPYPAGPDDCETAALWLIEHAEHEFGTSKLTIGGESAGAHLSAVTLLRLRDRHGFSGFLAANLVFGAFDLSMTPSQRNWGERDLVLSTPVIEWFCDQFVPFERRRDPDVSPLYAQLHELPPALFTVGTLDPLLDDSLFMHSRWVTAGNAAELAVYPGGIHGFTGYPTALARRAQGRIAGFLVEAVASA